MNVTTELRENRQLALTIEVPPDQVEAALAQAAKRLAAKYRVPGFRPGKAPRAVIERMLGKQALYEEVIDQLGQKLYKEALEQQNIEPFGPGEMEDVSLDPLVFKMLIPLAPVVKLGDYRSVRVPYVAPQVDEHEVEHQLEHIREDQAIIAPAGDGPAEAGMIAKVDIEGTVNGEPFISQQHGVTINLYPELDRDEDLLDFSAGIIGMQVGEEKTFDLAIPDSERYGEFAGKTGQFRVKLLELQKRELPDFDDALAQTVGDFETLDALKAQIRSEILASKRRQADSEYGDRVIDEFVKIATIEYPPQLVEQEIDALVERTEKRMKDQGMTLDEYLKALNKSAEEYRQELRPTAEIRLKRGLVLNQLIREEQITVSDDEVTERIERMAAMYGEQTDAARKAFSGEESRHAIHLDMLSSAGMARAVAIAKGEAPALAPTAESTAEAATAA